MHYNIKGEKIYYSAPSSSSNSILNLTLLGETVPTVGYEALHRIGIDPQNNMYTFEYITKGKLMIAEGKTVHTAKAGDVMILNHNTSHYYYTDPHDLVSKYFFVCNGTYVDNMMATFGIHEGTVIRPMHFPNEFIDLFAVAQGRPQQLLPSVAELILKILYTMNPLLYEDAKYAQSTAFPLHQQIANYIDTHIREALRLDDIAAHFSTTTITMNRIFREHYDTTPKQYILNARIEVAKQLLSGTNLSINRISDYLSFAHQNNFTNTFTKATGLSPSQYRKQNPYIVHKPTEP